MDVRKTVNFTGGWRCGEKTSGRQETGFAKDRTFIKCKHEYGNPHAAEERGGLAAGRIWE